MLYPTSPPSIGNADFSTANHAERAKGVQPLLPRGRCHVQPGNTKETSDWTL